MTPQNKMSPEEAVNYIETEKFWFAKKPEKDGGFTIILKESAFVKSPKTAFEHATFLQKNSEEISQIGQRIKNRLTELEKKGIIKRLEP